MKKLIRIAAVIGTGLLSFCASAQELADTSTSFSMKTVCEAFPHTCGASPSGDGFGSELPKDPPKDDPDS